MKMKKVIIHTHVNKLYIQFTYTHTCMYICIHTKLSELIKKIEPPPSIKNTILNNHNEFKRKNCNVKKSKHDKGK